jgi:hypothetical protein
VELELCWHGLLLNLSGPSAASGVLDHREGYRRFLPTSRPGHFLHKVLWRLRWRFVGELSRLFLVFGRSSSSSRDCTRPVRLALGEVFFQHSITVRSSNAVPWLAELTAEAASLLL